MIWIVILWGLCCGFRACVSSCLVLSVCVKDINTVLCLKFCVCNWKKLNYNHYHLSVISFNLSVKSRKRNLWCSCHLNPHGVCVVQCVDEWCSFSKTTCSEALIYLFFHPNICDKLGYNIWVNKHSIFCSNFAVEINCPICTKIFFLLNFTFLFTWLHFISLAVGYRRRAGDCVDGLWHGLHRALHGCAWEQPARLWGGLCGTACGQAAQRVSIHTQTSRQ